MSINYSSGDAVFFVHPQHSWVRGSVVSVEKDSATCKVDDKERKEVQQGETVAKVKADGIEMFHSECLDDAKHDDLLHLSVLHEATLLRCLYLRYMTDIIYTNIGAIVVALNPFNYEISRYKDDRMSKFLALGKHFDKVPNHGLYPHSWACAHNTYYEMIENSENQCVLISGESGAGKTEATKIVMKYLAGVSCLGGTAEEKKHSDGVGAKLTASSPILECFGNAKTVRNDNSSRFGKFMEVKFNGHGRLVGAFTTKYLLEKSRIITASEGERIYHSFYVALRGKYKGHLQFESESTYISVNSGKCLSNKEYDTADDFEEVCDAMKKVGMSDDEVKSVWHIPAAILNLLNVGLLEDKTEREFSTFDDKTQKFLVQAARLLYVSDQELLKELLYFVRTTPDGDIVSRTSTEGAVDARNALCKHMYDGVFAWLVEKCNETCDAQSQGNWIGLLDIFGFEDFKLNSFEQLCINLTNETLQGHYNNFIFNKDMAECRAEGIDVADIISPDNTKCIQMLTGQGGVIPLLDECCAIDKSTDFTFLDKVDNAHSKNAFYGKNKTSRDTFFVRHYAGDVTYTITSWIEKNKDTLRDQMKLLIRRSTDKIIAQSLPLPIPKDLQKGKAPTVGGFFALQLRSLMEKINATNPHWIRCVKPHPAKKALHFDGVMTMKQLESSGVLGTVKIRKAGYPVRIQNDNFLKKYRVCVTVSTADPMARIESVLAGAGVNDKKFSQKGRTKVFLKTEALTKLERFRDECLKDIASSLQRIGSGYVDRKKCFLQYVEKHRAELLRLKKEREERERAEREAEERAKREAEEKARLLRDAEERRRKREEQKLQEKKSNAAICMQRYVRGGLCRLRVFRQVLEETRAKFEAYREAQFVEERRAARAIDTKRQAAEKQWISWLNNVDHLKMKNSVDQQRQVKHDEQKRRINVRELCRKEDEDRQAMEADETHDRQALMVRCELVASHKKYLRDQETRAKKLFEQQTNPIRNATRTPPPTANHRSARSDARTKEMLSDYAASRAKAFEEFFPPPPPKNTFAALSDLSQQRSTPGRPSDVASRERFQVAKERWVAQDHYLESHVMPAPLSRPQSGPSYSQTSSQPLDEMYSGPHRTVGATMQYRTPASSARAPPHQRYDEEPPWLAAQQQRSPPPRDAQQPSAQKHRGGAELRSAIDWDSVFNS
jgi:myosin heavy subunit